MRIVQQGQRRDLLLAGVCVGLAGGTKYPAAIVAAAVVVACLLRGGKWRDLLLAGGSAVGAFALASPYVILDPGRAWDDLAAMGDTSVTVNDESITTTVESGCATKGQRTDPNPLTLALCPSYS